MDSPSHGWKSGLRAAQLRARACASSTFSLFQPRSGAVAALISPGDERGPEPGTEQKRGAGRERAGCGLQARRAPAGRGAARGGSSDRAGPAASPRPGPFCALLPPPFFLLSSPPSSLLPPPVSLFRPPCSLLPTRAATPARARAHLDRRAPLRAHPLAVALCTSPLNPASWSHTPLEADGGPRGRSAHVPHALGLGDGGGGRSSGYSPALSRSL